MLLSPELVVAKLPKRELSLRMDDLLILVISFGWLARNAIYKELGLLVKTPLNTAVLLYVAACSISTIFGIIFGRVSPLQGTMFVIKYIEFFAVFFMVMGSIHSREQIKRYLIALFATALLISIYAALQIPTGARVTAPFEGWGGEPNTLGGYLVLIISILGGIILSFKSTRIKIISTALIVFAMVPFMYTLSRSSWTAIAGVCIAFIIFGRQRMPLVMLLFIFLAVTPIITFQKVEQRYKETFMERPWESEQQIKIGGYYLDLSSSSRIIMYKRILQDIKNHPILGYGITGYTFIDGQYFRTLIETGLIGLSAFIYLLYSVFLTIFRIYRNSSDELIKGISLGLLAGFTGLLVHALSANTFIIIRIMEPFWLVMAMVVAGAGLAYQPAVNNTHAAAKT